MMYEFIPSEYYRNFCIENNIQFTDREWSTIILNDRGLPLKKKLEGLAKAAAESSDEVFKQVMDVRIKNTQWTLDSICSSENGRVFLSELNRIPFDEFEAARKDCKASHKRGEYRIEKYCVLASCDDTSDYKSYYSGGVLFNKNDEIIDVWDNEIEFSDEYTNCFIPFVNPFERGDIVRDCRDGRIGVVETSQNEWSDYLKQGESNKAYDYMDSALIVQFLGENSFSHSHIQPIYLEKLPLNEKGIPECFDTKNNLEEDLLTCVSELMRGDIALDVFMSIFLEWREERIYKEIESRSWRK